MFTPGSDWSGTACGVGARIENELDDSSLLFIGVGVWSGRVQDVTAADASGPAERTADAWSRRLSGALCSVPLRSEG